MAKPQSLYTMGMKPSIYSKSQHAKDGKGWFRGGEDIKYFQNEIPRKHGHSASSYGNNQILYNNNGAGEGSEYHYTFSFVYEFEEEEDEVWFANAIPYTFTDLQANLKDLTVQTANKHCFKTNILCRDLTGSPCPMVTITDKVNTYLDYYDEYQLNKELPSVLRKQMFKKMQKAKKLYRQSLESKGKVRKLLRAAFEEEINSFYENNIDSFKSINSERFSGYHHKLKQYVVDHFHKKAVVITSRVHPGEP